MVFEKWNFAGWGIGAFVWASVWGGSIQADSPVESLKSFLAEPAESRPALEDAKFSKEALSAEEAKEAVALLAAARRQQELEVRKSEYESRKIKMGDLAMPFHVVEFGEKPAEGRSLVLSMHGGGGAPPRVNDQQWENQKRLYKLEEGFYVAPRAPTDTWDLWHQSHMDAFFERLIEDFLIVEGVDSDRVYLMGYSAGGDGVFQLAPRMADRFAAAAMMAGHPNETVPLGLRNLPFTLHMGEKDAAYDRNRLASEWRDWMEGLQKSDPKGYPHWVKIHSGKGHWMDRQDAEALPWMYQFRRNIAPEKIVWKQDDVVERRFYWLSVPEGATIKDRALVEASRNENEIRIVSDDVDRIRVRLRDDFVDLEKDVVIQWNGKEVFRGRVPRTIDAIDRTLRERFDPKGVFFAEVEVSR